MEDEAQAHAGHTEAPNMREAHMTSDIHDLPPMPKSSDRMELEDGSYYLESDRDWATNNPEVITWLADHHQAIRKVLADKWRWDNHAQTLALLEKTIEQVKTDNERLRLSMMGGEDAPGYAASVPLDDLIRSFEQDRREQSAYCERIALGNERLRVALADLLAHEGEREVNAIGLEIDSAALEDAKARAKRELSENLTSGSHL